jgi:hypothetical protein
MKLKSLHSQLVQRYVRNDLSTDHTLTCEARLTIVWLRDDATCLHDRFVAVIEQDTALKDLNHMLKVCSLLCLVGHVSQEVNDLNHLRSLQLILSPRHVEGLHVVDEKSLKLQAQLRVLLFSIEVLQHVQEKRLNLDALFSIKY